MKLIFSLIFLSIALAGNSQSASHSSQSSPEKISAIAMPVISSPRKITEQANSWRQQTLQDPANADAWLNYYTWMERSPANEVADKETRLKNIVTESAKNIAGSWQYALLSFLQSGKKDSSALFTALNGVPDKTIIYPYAIQLAIITRDEKRLAAYCKALEQAKPMTENIYEYHYNTLMSAEKNATIYAKGLNDLVPLAMLQQIHQVRKDIRLKYYDGIVKEQENAYLCLSLGKEVLSRYPNSGYTGLLVKLKPIPLLAELEKHLLRDFSFGRLKAYHSLSEEEQLIYRNYLPSFLILYRYYKMAGNPATGEWKDMIQKLAEITGSAETVNRIIADK